MNVRRPLAVVVGTVLNCSTSALAHGSASDEHAWLGPALFVLDIVVAGGAVALDARDAVGVREADLGVLVGGALALGGFVWYFVV